MAHIAAIALFRITPPVFSFARALKLDPVAALVLKADARRETNK